MAVISTLFDGLFGDPLSWILCLIVFILSYNYIIKESWRNLPPGPPALPVLGSLPWLGGSYDTREPLRRLAKKYGDVFTVYLGSKRTVVLHGYDVIKDAFIKHGSVFSGRAHNEVYTALSKGHGIVFTQGPMWQEQRSYALQTMREFGMGKTILEDKILQEVSFCIQELRKNMNTPYCPIRQVQKSVANVVASVLLGNRMDYEDPSFRKYMDIMNLTFDMLGTGCILNVFPNLRYLPGDMFRLKKFVRGGTYLFGEYKRLMKEHISAGEQGEPTNFIGAYVQKMASEKKKQETNFTEYQLCTAVNDMFLAGTETIATTLSWAIMYLAMNPGAQAKCQAEIEENIGPDEEPSMSHRASMPYTEACVWEAQRMADVGPFAIPHATTEDVHFRGYLIPKGTTVTASIYSVHRDPKLWPEPFSFQPERFIDDEGGIINREELIPFSIGKRQCLGMLLARTELFLYFASFMKHFKFSLAPGYPEPSVHGTLGLTHMPRPFHVIMEPRLQNPTMA